MQWLASLIAGVLAFFSSAFSPAAPVPLPVNANNDVSVAAQRLTPRASAAAPTQATVPPAVTSGSNTHPSVSSSASLPEGGPWETTLPLGDGKYSTTAPKKGYIYICHVASGGGGAQGKATWISGTSWYPLQKVAVSGSISWPNAAYNMSVSASARVITANGLPTDHPSGTFPIQRSDPAYQYDANPNSIKAQSYSFSLPLAPTPLSTPDCIFGQVGIMRDGVTLFDGFDAEYRDAVAHETQDQWQAHPDQSGEYHYHGFESGFVKDGVSTVVGFAFDGYPITGSALPSGKYLHTSDLDECHGLTSAVSLDGVNVTTYHYVLTQDFPYSVACFHARSHEPKPGGGGQTPVSVSGQAQTQQGPPQAAIDACSNKSEGAACSFTTPRSTVSGTCKVPPGSTLACVPQ